MVHTLTAPAAPTRLRLTSHSESLMSNDAATPAGNSPALHPDLVSPISPEQILHEDEIVLLLTKPSILYIFYSSFRMVLGTLMLGILAARMTSAAMGPLTPRFIATATVLICLARLIWALLVWTSHVYMLTNQRIVTIKGVINVHMFQAHLRKIQKIEMYRPLAQRLLGTATIGFATAAAAASLDSTWLMLAHPLQTHEQIVAAINKSQSR